VARLQRAQPESGESRPPELGTASALEPLRACIESVREGIRESNERIEKLAHEGYPPAALLQQVKGVGRLIALTFLLTLEDPHRVRKSREVGWNLGRQPGRRNSGKSAPQLPLSKEGDPYLGTRLVQGAQHILGPFGVDCDLRG
jgi:transposase